MLRCKIPRIHTSSVYKLVKYFKPYPNGANQILISTCSNDGEVCSFQKTSRTRYPLHSKWPKIRLKRQLSYHHKHPLNRLDRKLNPLRLPHSCLFLTPRKNKTTPSKAADPPGPTTPPRTGSKSIAASPFGPHYQQTRDITVEPFVASIDSGPWSPIKSKAWASEDDDPFSAGNQWAAKGSVDSRSFDSGDEDEIYHSRKTAKVTLSQLLDNVVILEESIKELVAIIHARRSLGIDAVRYL